MTATCTRCDQPIDRIDGAPDPRTARVVFMTSPCRHIVSPIDAVTAGVPATIAAPTGANLIAAERHRVVTEEGYTPAHDEGHTGGQLAWAVWCLLDRVLMPSANEQAPAVWPFDRDKWPTDKTPLRLLIIAGQYIAAEIERRLAKGERP